MELIKILFETFSKNEIFCFSTVYERNKYVVKKTNNVPSRLLPIQQRHHGSLVTHANMNMMYSCTNMPKCCSAQCLSFVFLTTFINIYIYIYIHTYTYTYTYIYMKKIKICMYKNLSKDLKISLLNFNFVIYTVHKILILIQDHLNDFKDNIFKCFFKKYDIFFF